MRKINRSCNTLAIAKFFRIIDTDDLRNLVVGFDFENPEFELTNKEQIELQVIFDDIFYDYCDITENFKLKGIKRKEILLAKWTFKHKIVTNLMNLYVEFKQESTLKLLDDLEDQRFKINFDKPIDPQIDAIVRKLKGLKNKIVIFKMKIAESVKSKKTETKMDLDQDALYLERNLELKREIDPETTSISKWVKMIRTNKLKK